MQIKKSFVGVTVVCAISILIVGCSRGNDHPPAEVAVQPTVQETASKSVANFLVYIQSLVSSDSTEPVTIDGIMPPSEENTEPTTITV